MNRDLFITLLLLTPFMGYGQIPKSFETKIVQDIQVEEIMEPPPPKLTSKFKEVKHWLADICDSNKPKKTIAKYRIGLFESINDYTLFLVGVNTYEEDKNRSSTRIEFEPKNMYFKLPKSYYKNLTRQQILEKLASDLKAFANTEKFKDSFFTNANIVTFETTGVIIWSKK